MSWRLLGIKIDYSGNVKFKQVPIVGSDEDEFARAWSKQKMEIMRGISHGGLSQRQVALYLLRKAGHWCTIVYCMRACPRDLIKEFVSEFDDDLRGTLESVVGLAVDDRQWDQVGLRIKQSGLGL